MCVVKCVLRRKPYQAVRKMWNDHWAPPVELLNTLIALLLHQGLFHEAVQVLHSSASDAACPISTG